MNQRIFILQNTDLASGKPLSVFLTNLLINLDAPRTLEINLIAARSASIPAEVRKRCKAIFQLDTTLYSPMANLSFAWKAFVRLRSEHMAAPIDLVHCLYPNSSLLAAILFKRLVNPLAVVLYEVRSPWIEMIFAQRHMNRIWAHPVKGILRSLEGWLTDSVDYFIFVSEGLRQQYHEDYKIDEQKAIVLPTPVELNAPEPDGREFPKELNYSYGSTLLGYVGTIDKSRRLDELLTIFKQVLEGGVNAHLVFVGDGNALGDLRKLSKESGMEERVRFLGRVAHEEIPAIMRKFDFGISHLPAGSLYDHSSPLKVMEYLSVGVPVLASDMRAHRELASQLDGILLYGDADTMAVHLGRARPRVQAKQLQARSWKTAAIIYLDLYQTL